MNSNTKNIFGPKWGLEDIKKILWFSLARCLNFVCVCEHTLYIFTLSTVKKENILKYFSLINIPFMRFGELFERVSCKNIFWKEIRERCWFQSIIRTHFVYVYFTTVFNFWDCKSGKREQLLLYYGIIVIELLSIYFTCMKYFICSLWYTRKEKF